MENLLLCSINQFVLPSLESHILHMFEYVSPEILLTLHKNQTILS